MTISLRKIALAGVSAMAIGYAAPANAFIQLGFLLDESGSIGQSNYNTIISGLSAAVANIPLGGQYEVSVVTFDSGATARISNFLLTNAASLTSLQTQINAIAATYNGGGTSFAPAFTTMQSVLANTIANATASYVNMATDGVNSDPVATAAARALLTTTGGVDNISIEGIGSGVDQTYLTGSICFPAPCTVGIANVNFPTNGFYIPVANAAAYATAIGEKIQIVTTPEPVSMAIFGMGLAGLGFAATRRRKAA